MLYRSLIGTVALAAGLAMAGVDAQAFDQTKYPDWAGAWRRIRSPASPASPVTIRPSGWVRRSRRR